MAGDEQALLAAIFAAPDDDLSRLVYADWLDEHQGDEGRARAEFIRLQCELARLEKYEPRAGELSARCGALLKTHKEDWIGGVRYKLPRCEGTSWQFRRGFVEGHHVSDADLRTPDLERLCRTHPVTDITVGTMPVAYRGELDGGGPSRFPDWPHLPRVRKLSLCPFCRHHPEDLQRLLASPLLTGLRGLGLASESFGDEEAAVIAATPGYRTLRSLDVGPMSATDDGIARLLRSPHLSGLTEVGLAPGEVPAAALAALANAAFFPRLGRLSFEWPDFLPHGQGMFARLLGRPLPPGPGGEAILGLIADPRLGRLERLCVRSVHLGDAAVEAVSRAAFASHLSTLELWGVGLTAGGVARLLGASHLGKLTALDLGSNQCGAGWLPALRTIRLPVLVRLDLQNAGLRPVDVELFGRSAAPPALRHLDLSGNDGLGDPGAKALAASPRLAGLQSLSLQGCGIGAEGADALARSPLASRMTWQHLQYNPVIEAWTEAEWDEYLNRPITEWPPGRGPRSASPRG